MSKQLLTEYYELCPNGVCEDILTESDKRFVKDGGLIMSGVIQRSDVKNGNGRVYPHSILVREMNAYKKLLDSQMVVTASSLMLQRKDARADFGPQLKD